VMNFTGNNTIPTFAWLAFSLAAAGVIIWVGEVRVIKKYALSGSSEKVARGATFLLAATIIVTTAVSLWNISFPSQWWGALWFQTNKVELGIAFAAILVLIATLVGGYRVIKDGGGGISKKIFYIVASAIVLVGFMLWLIGDLFFHFVQAGRDKARLAAQNVYNNEPNWPSAVSNYFNEHVVRPLAEMDANTIVGVTALLLLLLLVIVSLVGKKESSKLLLFAATIAAVVWLVGFDNLLHRTRNLLSADGTNVLRTVHNGHVSLRRGETDRFVASGTISLNNYTGWKLCIQPEGIFNIVEKNQNLTIWISPKSGHAETAIVTSMLPETPC
jgi:hypothetical protein